MNILIIGAGRGGREMIDIFSRSDNVNIVGVVDIDTNAPGMVLARQKGIPTASDWTGFLAGHGVDNIIEVTGKKDVYEEIESKRPQDVNLISAFAARSLWTLFQEYKRSALLRSGPR